MARVMPRQEKFKVNYTTEQLPALFSEQNSDADFTSALLQIGNEHLTTDYIGNAQETLLVACDLLQDASVIQHLQRKADAGVRIYILLGERADNKDAINCLSGRCLIRSGVAQRGALFLIDHSTSQQNALLLTSGSLMNGFCAEDITAWGIKLESDQIDDCFRSFCKLFWEKSSAEHIRDETKRQVVKHPDGNILTNHTHHLSGTLSDNLTTTLDKLTGASRSSFVSSSDNCHLLLNANDSDVKNHARSGVALTNKDVPSVLLSNDGNWVLPCNVDFSVSNWCLKLSKTQKQQLSDAYDKSMKEAAWQYKTSVRLGELCGLVRLRFSDQPNLIHSVEVERKVQLDDIYTECIESFINDEASDLALAVTGLQRAQLAHDIQYDLVVHPPYCPVKANRDELYIKWDTAERNWQEQLSRLVENQLNIDKQHASTKNEIKVFVKAFLLGQAQSVKKLNQEIDMLKKWSVSTASPAKREEYRKRLEALTIAVNKRSADTTQELEKAEKNAQWESKLTSMRKELSEKKAIVNQTSDNYEQLKAREPADIEAIERKFKDAWSIAANNLTDAQLELIPENIGEASRNKKHVIAEFNVTQATAWKESKKQKIWVKHFKEFKKALSDRQEGLAKIRRNFKEKRDILIKIQGEVTCIEKAMKGHGCKFSFITNTKSEGLDIMLGQKEKLTVDGSFNWPDEDLPFQKTELRKYKSKRYLVINDIEQLEQARLDSQRLNAVIVCDQE